MANIKMPPNTAPKEGTVTFSPLARVRHISKISSSDISGSCLWDDKGDLSFRRTRDTEIINVMNCSSEPLPDNEDEDICSRGLEKRTIHGHRQRRETRLWAMEAVFGEQERQEKENLFCPEKIASIYGLFTKQALNDAQRQGTLDAQYVTSNTETYMEYQTSGCSGWSMKQTYRPSTGSQRMPLCNRASRMEQYYQLSTFGK